MILSTLIFIVSLVAYIGIAHAILGFIVKKKNTITMRFLKSLFISLTVVLAIYFYMNHFESTREISNTIFKSGTLIIALLSFSCQKVLGNIISGLVISSKKPFEINDKIGLVSQSGVKVLEGVVIDINARHTFIKQTDGKCCLVPNGVLDEMIIVNNDIIENNGYPLALECTYESDVTLAMKLMKQEIESHPLTIKTDLLQTNVTCSSLNANGFELKAIIFTKTIADSMKACSDLRISIFKVWKENGIEIPFNTITIVQNS